MTIALRANTSGWLKVAIDIAAFAGLRLGEVQALEVRDVDFTRQRLLGRRARSLTAVLPPKSNKERVIPLAPARAETLKAATANKKATDRILRDEGGVTPNRQEVLRRLKQQQKRLGLPDRSFHALRHYFCSTLVQRGASIEGVRTLAGHSDPMTTQRYVHATASDLVDAMEKVGPAAPTRRTANVPATGGVARSAAELSQPSSREEGSMNDGPAPSEAAE